MIFPFSLSHHIGKSPFQLSTYRGEVLQQLDFSLSPFPLLSRGVNLSLSHLHHFLSPPLPSCSFPRPSASRVSRRRRPRLSRQKSQTGARARESRTRPGSVHAAAGGKRWRSRAASRQSSWQARRQEHIEQAHPSQHSRGRAALTPAATSSRTGKGDSFSPLSIGDWRDNIGD